MILRIALFSMKGRNLLHGITLKNGLSAKDQGRLIYQKPIDNVYVSCGEMRYKEIKIDGKKDIILVPIVAYLH